MIIKGNLKFIVDTGATHSIINPGLCNPKWRVNSSPITLKTLQNTVKTNIVYRVPCFTEFGKVEDTINFIECKFHDFYDGIIGNDVLHRYRAIIDYNRNLLLMNNKVIPLIFSDYHKVKFITNIECGLVHFKEYCSSSGECILEEGIYDVENFKLEIERYYQNVIAQMLFILNKIKHGQ